MSKKNVLTRSKKLKAEDLLNRGQLSEARELCSQVCQTDRTDAEAWALLALIERRLGHLPDAEQAARRAVVLRPTYALGQQILGTALHCQGRYAEAIASYRKACELQPKDAQTLYLLGNALRESGALAEADTEYARSIALRPDFVPALSNRGALLTALGRCEEAKQCLNRANELQPGLPQVLCNIAQVLQQEGRFDDARSYCEQTLQRDPDFVDAIVMLADLHEKSHRNAEATALIERGLKLAPENTALILTAARLARREGRVEDGIGLLEAARVRIPEALQGDVLLLLGQLYDKQKDAARAFHCLSEGNRIKASGILKGDGDTEHYLHRVESVRAAFRAEDPATWQPIPDDDFDDNPIFLLGFPRSGTTLLEQILDSHPRLQALEEKPTVSAMEHAFRQLGARARPYADLTPADIRMLRKAYFDTVARHIRRDPQRILVDKMPLATVQAHLIWRVFPKAKVILAIRHPCDACFSCFMQDFSLNNAMATFFSLEKTAEAYAAVMSLWREYIAALPIDYHRVRYEDLVADQAGETQRLLTFLNLEWDETVLHHDEHARKRGITTPSYHQVTKPIYQDAKYRWKRYEPYMQSVLPILQPYIEYFGYADGGGATAPPQVVEGAENTQSQPSTG